MVQRITRFTLFFIPLFPISNSYTTTCTFCGFSQRINKELADQYAGYAQQHGPSQQLGQQQPGQSQQQYGQPQYGNSAIR